MPGRWVYALGWTTLAVVYTASVIVSGAPPELALRGSVASVLPNALLGVVTLRCARHFLGADAGLGRTGLSAVGVSLLATSLWLLLAGGDTWLRKGSFELLATSIVIWQTIINALLHLALAGIGYAWFGREETRLARERADRAEALRARAELQLLRTQLNPHFALNTLHALLGLVRREPATAESVIERLGELLGFGMRVTERGSDRVTFGEEWAFVTSYLELERIRLGDRLRFRLDADPAMMDAPFPPFALQPLVENSVVHAIAPRAAGGSLSVHAGRDAGRLRIDVQDDGPGVSEEALLASPRAGLRLLRDRLAALYAGEARLTFGQATGGGLRVVLELPESGPIEAL
jgi:signal transduction histidine kinase